MLNFKKLTLAVASIGVLGAALPAQASIDRGDIVQTRIDARDLQTDRGLERVYEQLQNTAERKCSFGNRVGLSAQKAVDACAADLLNDFVENIDHPGLSSLHAQQ